MSVAVSLQSRGATGTLARTATVVSRFGATDLRLRWGHSAPDANRRRALSPTNTTSTPSSATRLIRSGGASHVRGSLEAGWVGSDRRRRDGAA